MMRRWGSDERKSKSVMIAIRPVDFIRARRSVRRFRPEPVNAGLIAELVSQAIWAPSPHNSQPWRFTLLTTESKARLAEAMGQRLRADLRARSLAEGTIEEQAQRSSIRIRTTPTAVLCSLVTDGLVLTGDARIDDLEHQMAVQSVGAVLQTLFLLAAERGIGTCWMAAPMYCPADVREVLDLPDEFRPQALVLLGYPADAGRIRPRRPMRTVLETR
jgi:coenzyme F420-0:L-glutamate ligase / coenzyme F420-1:gamma-L-glutamate ligase